MFFWPKQVYITPNFKTENYYIIITKKTALVENNDEQNKLIEHFRPINNMKNI